MNKLKLLYNEIAWRLCGIGSDKYVHLLAGLLISALVCLLLCRVFGFGKDTATVMGLLVASVCGLIKEALDIHGSGFDFLDLAFTILGGCIASALYWL